MLSRGRADTATAGVRAAAFQQLAEQHLDASYRLAHAIMGNRQDAEDATHDALVQAWRSWGSLRDPARFESWFSTILVNTCRTHMRRASKWRTQDISHTMAVGTDRRIGQADDRDLIGQLMASLSADHRAVVALRFYRDLSINQIAAMLGIRSGTVNSRLHYAMKALRAATDDAGSKGAER